MCRTEAREYTLFLVIQVEFVNPFIYNIHTVEIARLLGFIFRRVIQRPHLGLYNTVLIPEPSSGTRHGHFQWFKQNVFRY